MRNYANDNVDGLSIEEATKIFEVFDVDYSVEDFLSTIADLDAVDCYVEKWA